MNGAKLMLGNLIDGIMEMGMVMTPWKWVCLVVHLHGNHGREGTTRHLGVLQDRSMNDNGVSEQGGREAAEILVRTEFRIKLLFLLAQGILARPWLRQLPSRARLAEDIHELGKLLLDRAHRRRVFLEQGVLGRVEIRDNDVLHETRGDSGSLLHGAG